MDRLQECSQLGGSGDGGQGGAAFLQKGRAGCGERLPSWSTLSADLTDERGATTVTAEWRTSRNSDRDVAISKVHGVRRNFWPIGWQQRWHTGTLGGADGQLGLRLGFICFCGLGVTNGVLWFCVNDSVGHTSDDHKIRQINKLC